MDGEQLCDVTAGADVLYQKNFALLEARLNMLDTVNAETVLVHEYLTAMESAPPLTAVGLGDGYKILCEFNGAILAGKEREPYGPQIVTWERDGGSGLNYGHYYEDDFFSCQRRFCKTSQSRSVFQVVEH